MQIIASKFSLDKLMIILSFTMFPIKKFLINDLEIPKISDFNFQYVWFDE